MTAFLERYYLYDITPYPLFNLKRELQKQLRNFYINNVSHIVPLLTPILEVRRQIFPCVQLSINQHLAENFVVSYKNGYSRSDYITIDEKLVGIGEKCNIRQCILSKLNKCELKICTLCGAKYEKPESASYFQIRRQVEKLSLNTSRRKK